MTNVDLEWEITDESASTTANWSPHRVALIPNASHKPRRRRFILCAVFLALLVSSVGMVHLMDRAEKNIAQIEHEIELAVDSESWRQNPSGVRPHIQVVELRNDLAIVQISRDNDVIAAGDPAIVETMLYRQRAKEWERIGTSAAALASYRRALESDHFIFQHYDFDHNIVAIVAPAIEAFNAELHRDVGLVPPPSHAKVLVTIVMLAGVPLDDFSAVVDYVVWSRDQIIVPSPTLLRVRVTISDVELLQQALYVGVASRVIDSALRAHKPQTVWQDIVSGLQLWANSTHPGFPTDLDNEMDNLLRQQLAGATAPRLPVLSVALTRLTNPEVTQVMGWQRSATSKTVIDYIIATYGRGSLARLLKGMHDHVSWQTLIPAVFGVPSEQFERGWQAYLAAQYDLKYSD